MNLSSGRSGSKTMMTNLLLYKSKINRRYRHGWIGVGPTGYITSERFGQIIRYCLNQETVFISRDRQVPISHFGSKAAPKAQPPPPVIVRRLGGDLSEESTMRGCGAGTVHSFQRTKMELMDYRVHYLTGLAVRDASGPRTGESGNGIADPAGKSAGCK